MLDEDKKTGGSLARSALDALSNARLETIRVDSGAEALCLIPASTTGPLPWVVKIHGGPHSASLDSFNVEAGLFLMSGVAVIYPNYRGSIGFGQQFIDDLLGHIGEMDVADCVALTKASLQRFSAELDPKRGAAYGGSHGGYLTAWLLGCEDRDLYSCGVLWNPVVDLPAMLGTTDIPEWVAAEGGMGNEGVEWPITPEQLVNLHKRSPLSVIDKVSAPALMLLGAADQRVPHKQGRSWVSALQSLRQKDGDGAAEVMALEFPGDGHAIPSIEGNAHAVQTAVAWLVERLKAK